MINKKILRMVRSQAASKPLEALRLLGGYYDCPKDDDELTRWLKNRYNNTDSMEISPQIIPLIWLPRTLRPTEYPHHVGALITVLKNMGTDKDMLARFLTNEKIRYKSVLIGFSGRLGSGFAGLCIDDPPNFTKSKNPLKNGFRQMPPVNIVLMRYKSAPISGIPITRLDSSWIHGRDHNPQGDILVKKKVVLFGIGSIGSIVAELLARSGIGKLTLVDPEVVVSENISRHALGVSSIGRSKSLELKRLLASDYPHLEIAGYQKSCEEFARSMYDKLLEADLIISSIGNWRIESFLNALATETAAFPPVLYGWTEAHAAAGHAVVFFHGRGCLHCLGDSFGRIKFPVTRWVATSTLIPVPACGGHFQPYGAVELSHVHALIADLIIDVLLDKVETSTHRVWIGQRKILEEAGGNWNPDWVRCYGDPGSGGVLEEIEVIPVQNCPECGSIA